jgi:hypothetical protein
MMPKKKIDYTDEIPKWLWYLVIAVAIFWLIWVMFRKYIPPDPFHFPIR